jgi:hypothetical protein
MISVEKFLTVLKDKDLVPQDLLTGLFNQQAHHVTAAEIAQRLIDEGYLTPALANRLMGIEIGQSAMDSTVVKGRQEPDQDLSFAPDQDQIEPRPVLGKHRYKPDDSTKSSGSPTTVSKPTKPVEASPPKSILVDTPPPSRWATSAYDRELDSSRGIVSPKLVKMAGMEQVPTTLFVRRRNRWLTILIRFGTGLGLFVILYILIHLIITSIFR